MRRIAEILSKPTEAYDRREKFAQYHTLDTLTHYLLISQDRPLVERFTRQADGGWLLNESAGLDAVMPVESVRCHFPLAEVPDRVKFDKVLSVTVLSVAKEEVEAHAAQMARTTSQPEDKQERWRKATSVDQGDAETPGIRTMRREIQRFLGKCAKMEKQWL